MRHEAFAALDNEGTMRIAGRSDWLARFTLLFSLVTALAHRIGLVVTSEYFWLLAFGGVAALAAAMMAVAALRRAWRYGEAGAARGVRAILISLVILAPYAYSGWLIVHLPALDDVSTDTVEPPLFPTLASMRSGAMNRIGPITAGEAARQLAAYPAVTGRRYAAAPDTVDEAVKAVIAGHGWQIAADREAGEPALEKTTEAIARSPILGYVFDVAVRITDEGESTYVDMRSASRYGGHDLGANADRILRFLEALDAEMANRAGG